jgi:hypothetical protein
VAGLLGQHGHDHQAQVALIEEAPAASAASEAAAPAVFAAVLMTMILPAVMVVMVMSKSVSQCQSLFDMG